MPDPDSSARPQDFTHEQVAELFFHAAREGQEDLLARFLDAGADPNRANPHGHTPLILAAYNGHVAATDLLLRRSRPRRRQGRHGPVRRRLQGRPRHRPPPDRGRRPGRCRRPCRPHAADVRRHVRPRADGRVPVGPRRRPAAPRCRGRQRPSRGRTTGQRPAARPDARRGGHVVESGRSVPGLSRLPQQRRRHGHRLRAAHRLLMECRVPEERRDRHRHAEWIAPRRPADRRGRIPDRPRPASGAGSFRRRYCRVARPLHTPPRARSTTCSAAIPTSATHSSSPTPARSHASTSPPPARACPAPRPAGMRDGVERWCLGCRATVSGTTRGPISMTCSAAARLNG